MEHDTKINFDDWKDQCPICKDIVETEDWPKTIECSHEVEVNSEKPPPCPICGSTELHMNIVTVPNKRIRGMSHNILMSCPSCGAGHYYDGVEAVSGKAKIIRRFPPEYDLEEAAKQLNLADEPEAKERAEQHFNHCLHLQAVFRVHSLACLDDGWDNLGYGVRPLERTDIMNRFYIWTNKQAVGEATEADNPLRKAKARMKKKKKKGWWG